MGLRARDFPTERVLSRTPLIIRTVDQFSVAYRGYLGICKSSQVKFLLFTQIQKSPPLVPGAGTVCRKCKMAVIKAPTMNECEEARGLRSFAFQKDSNYSKNLLERSV